MSLLAANLLSCGLFLCLIVGINLPPCLSSQSWLTCRGLTGRVASRGPVSLGGEIIAGSLLMYTQFNLTIVGVIEPQPVTGPEELASLISSQQLPANGVNASLHVTMADGQKCLCSISGGGVLNCSNFAVPKPPWPAHTGCLWHWAKGGMLMETNASRLSHSCLDVATTSVNIPDLFWPNNVTAFYNKSADNIFNVGRLLTITQKFNGSSFQHQVVDAQIGPSSPIRVSQIRLDPISLPPHNDTFARIYRKYVGWSRHCFHNCRVIFMPGSYSNTLGRETCTDSNPLGDPAMAAQLRDGCVWAFTVTCKPVLVRSDNPSLPCPPPSRLTTIPGPTKDPTENPSTSYPSPDPTVDWFDQYRRFILQSVGRAPTTAPIIELEIAALCSVVAFQLGNFLL